MAMKNAAATTRRRPTSGNAFSYVEIHRAAPAERVRMIKDGVPAARAKRIIADLSLPQGVAFDALRLSVATVNRKAAQHAVLAADEGERVLGVARLIGQLEAMIEESGDGRGFDARAWISRWLGEPLPALGGARPLDLLDTMEGQALVAGTLARTQSGAYA